MEHILRSHLPLIVFSMLGAALTSLDFTQLHTVLQGTCTAVLLGHLHSGGESVRPSVATPPFPTFLQHMSTS